MLLAEFCRRLGLDFGEIDILRDARDQRIYCVDVNTTPALPPISLPYAEMRRALGFIASVFRQEYFPSDCYSRSPAAAQGAPANRPAGLPRGIVKNPGPSVE